MRAITIEKLNTSPTPNALAHCMLMTAKDLFRSGSKKTEVRPGLTCQRICVFFYSEHALDKFRKLCDIEADLSEQCVPQSKLVVDAQNYGSCITASSSP